MHCDMRAFVPFGLLSLPLPREASSDPDEPGVEVARKPQTLEPCDGRERGFKQAEPVNYGVKLAPGVV